MSKLKEFLGLQKSQNQSNLEKENADLKKQIENLKKQHEDTLNYIDKNFLNWYLEQNKTENTNQEEKQELKVEDLIK